MNELSITGLKLTRLKQIRDERGAVFHYLKSSLPSFEGFGEVYFSRINSQVVKGWKFHREAIQHFVVPFGAVKIVVFDDRSDSKTRGSINEILLDDDENYQLLAMPPRLWYSFKCESENYALLANVINIQHRPDESENLPLINNRILYDWTK